MSRPLMGAVMLGGAALLGGNLAAAAASPYAPVLPGHTLAFPRDYGSHNEFRTEWWYVTGWLNTPAGETLGFQITFFRTKPDGVGDNPSAFAAHQVMIAHCALSDAKRGQLWQDQRVRRAGLGLAGASETDTDVWIDPWRLVANGGQYGAQIRADGFAMQLKLAPTQAPLINGENGFSRKGPSPESASYYYSLPHLKVQGTVLRGSHSDAVKGEAWFDHEWSSEYLDAQAAGWDWIGLNLDDGSALMAFRIRGLDGGTRWAGGTWRSGDGQAMSLTPEEVQFQALRQWTSPRTGVAYPVEWQVTLPQRILRLTPLLDDQENDTRLTTGAIYWEGAVQAFSGGRAAGRGYLELTGYGERLRLR